MSKEELFAEHTARLRDFIRTQGLDGLGGGQARPRDGHDPFNDLALRLFALQFEHVMPYRRLCEARGASPASVARWNDIPAAPTLAFREFYLTSLPEDSRAVVFYSSGTTQSSRSRHYHASESLAVYEESLLSWFQACCLGGNQAGAPVPGVCVMLAPAPGDAPHSSLVHMLDAIKRRFMPQAVFAAEVDPSGDWLVDLDCVRAILREAETGGRAVFLLGTAFSFVHLLDDLERRRLRFRLPAGSRVMETGGYKGRSRTLTKGQLHDLIGRRLGIHSAHIVSEYGMSELSSQAYDNVVGTAAQSTRRYFRFPPWARVVVVSPETGVQIGEGEAGLLRVFDLANVRSVAGIETEDVAVRRGDGFELLGRATAAEPRGCSWAACGTV